MSKAANRARGTHPATRIPTPEIRYPKAPETRYLKTPETRYLKQPEIRNPKPETGKQGYEQSRDQSAGNELSPILLISELDDIRSPKPETGKQGYQQSRALDGQAVAFDHQSAGNADPFQSIYEASRVVLSNGSNVAGSNGSNYRPAGNFLPLKASKD